MGYQLAIQAGRVNKKNLKLRRKIEIRKESLRRNHVVSSFNTQGRGNSGFRKVVATNIENRSSKTEEFNWSGSKKNH